MLEASAVYIGDCIDMLKEVDDSTVDLVYADPPFNTGKTQVSKRTGYSYADSRDDYIEWMKTWIKEVHRVLKPTGTFYLHMDEKLSYAVRYCVLDHVFGADNWLSTVIWSYNYGGRSKDRWPAKHDVINVYAKVEGKHVFNVDDIERIPYKAPEVQYIGRSREEAEKRIAAGQVPTDVWDIPIIGTNSKERVGYPTQKPLKLLRNVIGSATHAGDLVLDPFMGSGTTALCAHQMGRKFITSDKNDEAVKTTVSRLNEAGAVYAIHGMNPC